MPSISVSSPPKGLQESLGGRLGLISWVEDVLGCLLIMSFGPQREGSAGLALRLWERSALREKQPYSEHADVHLDILGLFFFKSRFFHAEVNFEFPERDAWLQAASIFFPEWGFRRYLSQFGCWISGMLSDSSGLLLASDLLLLPQRRRRRRRPCVSLKTGNGLSWGAEQTEVEG